MEKVTTIDFYKNFVSADGKYQFTFIGEIERPGLYLYDESGNRHFLEPSGGGFGSCGNPF